MSFLGGGTDYPAYFKRHGGETLVTAIDKFLTVSVHDLADLFEHHLQVHYSRVESVRGAKDVEISVVRETLRHLGIDGGIEIHLVGDIPARTGLGNSSATTVGLLAALHTFKGEEIDPQALAAEAVWIEQEMIGEQVGCQDQYVCAVGGFLHIKFGQDGSVQTVPFSIDKERREWLQARLVLIYTGRQRDASKVLRQQAQRTADGDLDDQLSRMGALVGRGVEILAGSGPMTEFGHLLDESWQLKRALSSAISSGWLDEIYARARAAGAIGGKLLGAGGGGFMLLYVEPDDRLRVRQALAEFKEVPFAFEERGTRLIFND